MKKILILTTLPLLLAGCNGEEERAKNTVDYVLIAEPALTGVLKTTPNVKIYSDLQKEYKTKSENKILTQASVFVKNTLSSDVIHGGIENKLKSSIQNMKSNPNSIATYMNQIENPEVHFGVKPGLAVEVMKNGNRMGIDYKPAYEIKNDINQFLNIFNAQPFQDEHIIPDAGEIADQSTSDLKIAVPTGAPSIAMSAFADLGSTGFETLTDPSTIVPKMLHGLVDVAILPTNVGSNAIVAKNAGYKILGTITFGNLYVASTGNDEDGVMDKNDYIVSFQKGAVPDKIFHYIYGNKFDNALHYVSSAQEAAVCLKLGKNLSDK